ncbi:uncharacterized protein LOC114828179 [Galendromus occidentalis]|uniref:Uncharacterized protein LOC114828179 n=1 Tax=Galendromus occidentalis TaxID=34638 RepID=A0AAJ7SE18_9ACAR|nr:uncharacterized protein LOC114828179 [Galendromus occidentalis]
MKSVFWIAIILGVFVQNLSGEGEPEGSEEEEKIGVCGPVPNHGQMMGVLKPMSHVVVCAVNQIMDYGILLKDIQRVVERICVVFDNCVPKGKLANNKADNPEVVCLKKEVEADPGNAKGPVNKTAVDLVFRCLMVPLLPLQKQPIWSVIHWVLQMTNM